MSQTFNNGWSDEESFGVFAIGMDARATTQNGSALLLGQFDIGEDFVHVRFRYDGANAVGIIQRIAHLQQLHLLHKSRFEFFVNGPFDKHPTAAQTYLTLIRE